MHEIQLSYKYDFLEHEHVLSMNIYYLQMICDSVFKMKVIK